MKIWRNLRELNSEQPLWVTGLGLPVRQSQISPHNEFAVVSQSLFLCFTLMADF